MPDRYPTGAALGGHEEEASVTVTDLEPNREYDVCVVALHEGEPSYGNQLTFKTAAPAPEIKNQSATGVGPFEERIEATVNPENQTASCKVEYGPSTAYGSTVPCEQASIEGGEQTVDTTLSLLAAASGYDYRVVLENVSHERTLGTGTFTTATPLGASVESEGASSVTATSAELDATLDPDYQSTSYRFQYSTTETGGGVLTGMVVTIEGDGPVNGTGGQSASVRTATLQPGTTYYYRVLAENETNTAKHTQANGAVQSFTTPPEASTMPTLPLSITTTRGQSCTTSSM